MSVYPTILSSNETLKLIIYRVNSLVTSSTTGDLSFWYYWCFTVLVVSLFLLGFRSIKFF